MRSKVALVAWAGLAAVACGQGADEACPTTAAPAGLETSAAPWPNATLLEDLLASPLTGAALSELPGLVDVLADEGTYAFVNKIVECALPAETSFVLQGSDGARYELHGLIGLAPEWAVGSCEEPCQEWVSACFLSRVNYWGVQVLVYGRGPHPAISDVPPEDEALFPIEEGAFYGNYFAYPQRVYACRGRGYDPLYMTVRRCTRPDNGCGITVVGTCDNLDGDTGLMMDRRACEGRSPEAGGGYVRCHNRMTLPGSDEFPPSKTYERVVTVHLRSSDFGDVPVAEPCP